MMPNDFVSKEMKRRQTGGCQRGGGLGGVSY